MKYRRHKHIPRPLYSPRAQESQEQQNDRCDKDFRRIFHVLSSKEQSHRHDNDRPHDNEERHYHQRNHAAGQQGQQKFGEYAKSMR
jgi:hypothetical protein